jgi:hypothetical protein
MIDKIGQLSATAGNKLSKELMDSDEVSASRTVVATGSGAAIGAGAAVVLGVAGVAATPLVLTSAIAGGIAAGIASLFD